jgi:protein SCO1/2
MTNANITSEHLKNPPLSPFQKGGMFRSQSGSITPLWKRGARGDLPSTGDHRVAMRVRTPIRLSVLLSWVKNLSITLALIAARPYPAIAHDNTRPAALRDVAFDQKLDQQVPLDLTFRDESGKTVQLANYFNGKPVILTFVYFKCRDLCPLLLDGVVRTLRPLSFSAGNQFNLLTVSFDAHDTPVMAAAKKNDFVKQYGRPGAAAGWHFLTGDETAIQKLARSVGFHYTYDAHTKEFAHAAGIILLTPEGKTSRYFYGIDFSPRDLRLGLIEAAAARIGSPIDQLLLFCYHYDPVTGKYGLLITNVIRLAGLATVLILGAFIFAMLRRDRSNPPQSRRTA